MIALFLFSTPMLSFLHNTQYYLVIDFGFHCMTEICYNVIGSFCAEESSDIYDTNFYWNVKAISV